MTNYLKALSLTHGLDQACGSPMFTISSRLPRRNPDEGPLRTPFRGRIVEPANSLERGGPMYERLLVAIDHSGSSERVLEAAKDLAVLSKGEIWVMHLREREVLPRTGLVPIESDDEATAGVEAAVEMLNKTGVKAYGQVDDAVFGHAARYIVEAADEHDAGVIVMGSRGRSDLAGLALGSTAHKVIHLSSRPVLVVR
jgi:nucleotide-binding universal stress UspA family protein